MVSFVPDGAQSSDAIGLAVFAATRCLVEFCEIPVDAFSFEGTLPPAVISMARGWSV